MRVGVGVGVRVGVGVVGMIILCYVREQRREKGDVRREIYKGRR